MAFRLKLDDRPTRNLRRVCRQQISILDSALAARTNTATAIHEARKCIKRVRALLRLLRPGIAPSDFEMLNSRLAEVGRELSPARDRDVLVALISTLSAAPYDLAGAEVEALQKLARGSGQSHRPGTAGKRRAGLRKQIAEIATRLSELLIEPNEQSVVFNGLEDSYRRCRRTFARAYDDPSDEAFHDWRKDVQRHWRQCVLLKRIWPDYMQTRIVLARQIGEELGRDQDLGLLVGLIEQVPPGSLDQALREKILAETNRQRAAIRAAAAPLGQRMLAAKPRHFRRQIEVYWSSARALEKLTPGQ